MRFYAIKIKDSKPTIGIFEYIDGHLFAFNEDVNISTAVNGIVDGRLMFHKDLLKVIVDTPEYKNYISSESYNKIKASNANNWRLWPRGRVCYNVDTDEYEIYAARQLLEDDEIVNMIIQNFSLPRNKIAYYVDAEYDFKSHY